MVLSDRPRNSQGARSVPRLEGTEDRRDVSRRSHKGENMKTKRKDGRVDCPVVCNDWNEAFDCCRERGQPTVCMVGGEVGRCFPSGKFQEIKRRRDA